jgi:hypothetical protein
MGKPPVTKKFIPLSKEIQRLRLHARRATLNIGSILAEIEILSTLFKALDFQGK